MARAELRKFHYIYKTTCSITGKFYIGMHSTDDLNDGYVGSGKLLWYSIRKHGKENHHTEILEYLPSREELKKREKELVNQEMLNESLCMNLKLGGEGGWDAANKIPKPKEWHQAGAKAVNKLRSDKHSNKLKSDPEYAAKWRQSISDGLKDRIKRDDYVNPNLGNTYSDEVRKKMSELNMGEKNSQFGTCWVYNVDLLCSIKIPKDELNSRLDSGWIKGRKIFKEEQHVKET